METFKPEREKVIIEVTTLETEMRKQIFKNHNVLYRGEDNNENTSS